MTPRETVAWMQGLEVIALYFWGRSGSLFLHSLLDSHPEVLTLPALPVMDFHRGQWQRLRQAGTPAAIVAAFLDDDRVPPIFDGRRDNGGARLGELGEMRDTAVIVDRELFRRHMLELLEAAGVCDRRTFFLAVHCAYALARGQELGRQKMILYHMHAPNPTRTAGAVADFPGMRALGMVRQPLRALNSHLRAHRDGERELGRAAESEFSYLVGSGAYFNYYLEQTIGWLPIERMFSMPILPVRLESLHSEPRRTMEAVAAWLGLAWDDCLLKSTFNGLTYWGDQRSNTHISGFSKSHTETEEWRGQFDSLDQFVLLTLLGPSLERFGYGRNPAWKKLLLLLVIPVPTKLERQAMAAALRGRDPYGPGAVIRQIFRRWVFSYRNAAKGWGPIEALYRRMQPDARPAAAE